MRIPGRPTASDMWLRSRLDLMRETMIPAILSQTVAPDRWLVFCAADSPDWFKIEITEALLGIGEPVWIQEAFAPETSSHVISLIVQQYVTSQWLITTRIDNDDCVSRFLIEKVQSHFDGNEKFVNFPYGLQYEKGWIYHRLDMSNAFISFFERANKPLKTVFMDGHHLLKHHGTIIQAWLSPMWMQIVHDDNIANQIRGVRSSPKMAFDFATSLPLNKVSAAHLALLTAKDVLTLGMHVVSKPDRLNKLRKMVAGRPN
jgi:hypothetical protein